MPPNKAMQLTKPGQIGASQLTPVFDRRVGAGAAD
jgi:hypothetical protein